MYKNLTFALMALAGLLRDNWQKIATKTATTSDDLDQAELIGDQLVNAVGTREQTPSSVADITEQRQRNFTLFLNAYDEVRRAITFLRWKEDDLESVAPSLYSGRGNSNARKKGGDTGPATDHTPVNPPALAVPGAPAGTTASTGSTHPALPGTTLPCAAGAGVGLPGSNPFAR